MARVRHERRDVRSMSTLPAPRAIGGLQALHDARDEAAQQIADVIQRVLPHGFRGRITVAVDNGVVRAHDVAIEMRPPQPRNPMK